MATFRLVLFWILNVYNLVLLGRVLTTWIDPGMRNPISQVLLRLTEPVLAPIRRVLPQSGPFDFSPLVAFLILAVLSRLILAL